MKQEKGISPSLRGRTRTDARKATEVRAYIAQMFVCSYNLRLLLLPRHLQQRRALAGRSPRTARATRPLRRLLGHRVRGRRRRAQRGAAAHDAFQRLGAVLLVRAQPLKGDEQRVVRARRRLAAAANNRATAAAALNATTATAAAATAAAAAAAAGPAGGEQIAELRGEGGVLAALQPRVVCTDARPHLA